MKEHVLELSARMCSENGFLYEIVKRSLIFIHFHSMTKRRLFSENVKTRMWSSHFELVVPLITVFCYNVMNSVPQVLFFLFSKRSTWVPLYNNYVLIDLYMCSTFDQLNMDWKDTERLLKVHYNIRSRSRALASRFKHILAAFVSTSSWKKESWHLPSTKNKAGDISVTLEERIIVYTV